MTDAWKDQREAIARRNSEAQKRAVSVSRARATEVSFLPPASCRAISAALRPRLRRAWIMCDVKGSDHCPVAMELD